MDDQELSQLADPEFQQYFLVSPRKIAKIFDAAEIESNDRVLELGAGVGTVARHAPPCRSLTVVEYDPRLIDHLRANVPSATVVQGDALEVIREIPFDVLIGNLPNYVTDSLIGILDSLPFRTAVLAVGESADLGRLRPRFALTEVTTISGDDFLPSQPSVSRIVKVAVTPGRP
jgi:16S rRNA A1518/A1519 N6-dimethyltransferase RsmA/KsgA/DIM1 with predicted DNA glycosylase/AP lyase activity